MIKLKPIATLFLFGILFSFSSYADFSIPAEEVKVEEIFAGDVTKFSKPAEIDMNALVLATPEYQEIKKKKLDKGTGKYWILRNQATERAHKAVLLVIEDEEYDLISNEGYLGGLSTPIECVNLTKKALKIIKNG